MIEKLRMCCIGNRVSLNPGIISAAGPPSAVNWDQR
jgi:hypothetical protein